MKKLAIISVLFSLFPAIAEPVKEIALLTADYPYGEYRIHALPGGEAYLCYGALCREQMLPGVFTTEALFRQLKDHLQPNVPRSELENPEAECGMVTIRYVDQTEELYLICEVRELMEGMFEKANSNLQ